MSQHVDFFRRIRSKITLEILLRTKNIILNILVESQALGSTKNVRNIFSRIWCCVVYVRVITFTFKFPIAEHLTIRFSSGACFRWFSINFLYTGYKLDV